MIGEKFGRLTVLSAAGSDKWGNLLWECECDCGSETFVTGSHLRRGTTRSCGCLATEMISKRRKTHGLSQTRLYSIWRSMKTRCENPNNPSYKNYGGKGIDISWTNFESFSDWALENGYREDLTIDRIKNDKGYSPENCRWATRTQQNRNRSGLVMTIEKAREAKRRIKSGEPLAKIAKDLGCSSPLIGDIKAGRAWKDA